MRKFNEDMAAYELVRAIEIMWDNQPIQFDSEVEIDAGIFVSAQGEISYLCTREEDSNSTYMVWVNVSISDIEVIEYQDGEEVESSTHLNKRLVEKYMEQYILDL